MLNIAYVGFGKSTNRYHLPYINIRQDKFHVSRIVTPTLNKRPEEQKYWQSAGTIFSTDLQDILDDNSLDLVVVVTPAPQHFEIAKRLLQAGKNVLVDKPMVETPEQIRELAELAKENGLFVMPFQNRRFDSDFLTLRHVLATGYVGRPVQLEVHMDHYRPNPNAADSQNIMDGAWYGHGVHLVDQMFSLFGIPNSVSYDLRSTNNPRNKSEDQFDVGLFYDDNFRVTLSSSELVVSKYPKWTLHGTKGSYIKYNIDQQEYDLKAGIMPGTPGFGEDVPQDFGKLTYYNQNNDRIEKFVPTINGDYGRVYDSVFETLKNSAEKLVSDETMISVIDLLNAGFSELSPFVWRIKE
ncbi:MAG: oxidoreductase [Lactobacillaceae bacterium]|nr:oxidoreductase [Lactobacillaceae bacterium]